jgi:hypothetical protein
VWRWIQVYGQPTTVTEKIIVSLCAVFVRLHLWVGTSMVVTGPYWL